jgi:hypothetical protein
MKTDVNGNQQWNKTFGGPGYDGASSVQKTSDGGYILAGYTRSYGAGNDDAWLIKTDANGNHQWNKTFGGPGNDDAHSVQQTSDGGYILAGSIDLQYPNYDAWLIKTDPNGNQQWNKTFGGARGDSASSVQQTSDGGYIIAGKFGGEGFITYPLLIKTESNGNLRWEIIFGGTAGSVSSVQQTSDGGYILIGSKTTLLDPSGQSFTTKAWLIKVSGASGGNVGVSLTVDNAIKSTFVDIPTTYSMRLSENYLIFRRQRCRFPLFEIMS